MDVTTTKAVPPHSARQLVYRRFRVTVVNGPDRGRTADGSEGTLSIGTDPGNALVLSDPTVSRHHCVIDASASGYRIRDLDSSNGTDVAGHRVEAAFLNANSLVRVGVTTLKFELLQEEETQSLSMEGSFGPVLGQSVAMRRIFAMLPRIAGSNATVLIEGETGTGKGILAQTIHRASPRAAGPFQVVDCGAIPPTLIESELFGHEKGAFTGAHAARAGAFEAANGGTLFLDELGELPLDMQPKLLRALEERVVKRVGGDSHQPIDVRVLAATNVDLRSAVNRGAFRADLYFRLNVVSIKVPPLRERRDDVPALVEHFFEQLGVDPQSVNVSAWMADLCRYDWPGNVRELRSAVERAALFGEPDVWQSLQPERSAVAEGTAPAAASFNPSLCFRAAKERAVAGWEREYVRALYEHAGGNLSEAARMVKMDRTYLRDLLRRHGILESPGS